MEKEVLVPIIISFFITINGMFLLSFSVCPFCNSQNSKLEIISFFNIGIQEISNKAVWGIIEKAFSDDFLDFHVISYNRTIIDITQHKFCTNILKGEDFRKFTRHTFFIPYGWEKFDGQFFHLCHVFFSRGNFFGIPKDGNLEIYKYLDEKDNNNVSLVFHSKFDKVVYMYYDSYVYGHFIWDFLTPICKFPPEVFINSSIILCTFPKMGTEIFCKLFDIQENQCIDMTKTSENSLFYARELYTVKTKTMLYGSMAAIVDFVKLINKKFPPARDAYRYCLQNRDKGTKRSIPNFYELTNAIQQKFNQYQWETLPNNYYSIIDAVIDFQVIKLLFCPSGSGILNCIFFQPKSVVVEVMTLQFCQNDAFLSSLLDFYCIMFPWSDNLANHHFGPFEDNPVNVAEALYYIDIGISVAKNKKFPDSLVRKEKDIRMCW